MWPDGFQKAMDGDPSIPNPSRARSDEEMRQLARAENDLVHALKALLRGIPVRAKERRHGGLLNKGWLDSHQIAPRELQLPWLAFEHNGTTS